VKVAQAIVDSGLDIRWATDLKPEKYLTAERAELLRKSGAVACALGVESGSARVLKLIDGPALRPCVHALDLREDDGIRCSTCDRLFVRCALDGCSSPSSRADRAGFAGDRRR
jgi:hypothetical protein